MYRDQNISSKVIQSKFCDSPYIKNTMYIPPLPENLSAKATAAVLAHFVRFQEYAEPKIYFLGQKIPNTIETEKWMSEQVKMILPELSTLKQLFTPVELIRETAKKARSLNDPDLDRNLLRQFVIADGTLRFIDTIQNITGSGLYFGNSITRLLC